MARDENPPFERGKTFFGPDATIAAASITETDYLLGKEWIFEDVDYSVSTPTKPLRSGRKVRCRLVRNLSATTQYGKYLVTFKASAGMYDNEIDGMADTTAERAFPVDEFLPSTGVIANDLFWIVVEGPAMCRTPLEASALNVFTVGDRVVALTAATSGATTAGRLTPIDLTGATALLANQIGGFIGRALSAKTTANTNADVLVSVGRW